MEPLFYYLFLFGFVGDGDATKTAGGVEIDGVFAFFLVGFAIIGDTTENETGAGFNDDVFGNSDVDAAEESKGFDDGVFGEFGMSEVKFGTAKYGN